MKARAVGMSWAEKKLLGVVINHSRARPHGKWYQGHIRHHHGIAAAITGIGYFQNGRGWDNYVLTPF